MNEAVADPSASGEIAPDRIRISRLYQIVLGRYPESESIIDANVSRSNADMLEMLFGSLEFHINVNLRITGGRRPVGHLFDLPPSDDLIAWAASELPLSPFSRQTLPLNEHSWLTFYQALFSDEQFAPIAAPSLKPSLESVLDHLDQITSNPDRARIEGTVEEVSSLKVRGWVFDPHRPEGGLSVQLFIDGRFAAAGVADRFRRDMQDLHGGSGAFGFALDVPPQWRGYRQGARAEVIEVATAAVIGSGVFDSEPVELERADGLRAELSKVRQMLERMEMALPAIQESTILPLDRYSDYANAFYSQHDRLAPASGVGARDERRFGLIVDAGDLPMAVVARALAGVVGQAYSAWDVVIVHENKQDDAAIKDLARQTQWKASRAVEVMAVSGGAGRRLDGAFSKFDHDYVVLIRGDVQLLPQTLSALNAALSETPNVAMLYGDDDALEIHNATVRTDPILRPGFDVDLFHQQPDLGGVVLINTRLAAAAGGLDPDTQAYAVAELALRLAGQGQQVDHLSHILSSRIQSAPAEDELWISILNRRFSTMQTETLAEPHNDQLGAAHSSRIRVRRLNRLDSTSVEVIIPTRDNAQILRACIESLEASRARNKTSFRITIVDNGSEDESALAEISRAEQFGAHVIRYGGPFNWALLNNMAVDETDADVLIFLNDDTLVVTPNWCDELVEQALRPEVGAVGARLLYEDGTIQHAGVVLREQDNFAAHEGVGVPGSDGGYLGRHAMLRTAAAVTGACLATKRDLFKRMGGFDSASFPVEGNDIDYCLRLRSEGLLVIYSPYATLHHLESKTRGFSRKGPEREIADAAVSLLWSRWSRSFPVDLAFNEHFDRRSRPFAYLRPPRKSSR